MIARPEVKRTYSRLKREDPIEVALNSESFEGGPLSVASNFDEELSVSKPDKMRKITDFFRVKRDSPDKDKDSADTTTTTANINAVTCSSPITSVTHKLTQTYLDLGQRNLISIQCPDCLMHYNKSFSDDISLHKKFHSQYLKGYTFTLDPARYRESSPLTEEILKWSRFRFYAIDTFDSVTVKKMEFFLNFVHVQLGAEPLSSEEMRKPGKYSAIVAVEQLTAKIAGLALFEECSKVFRSRTGCSESAIELDNSAVKDEMFTGVSRIWVDSKHRSKGIASLLLDMKCSRKRENVAFSQPTPSGFTFAKSYQKNVNGLDGQCFIYLS